MPDLPKATEGCRLRCPISVIVLKHTRKCLLGQHCPFIITRCAVKLCIGHCYRTISNNVRRGYNRTTSLVKVVVAGKGICMGKLTKKGRSMSGMFKPGGLAVECSIE